MKRLIKQFTIYTAIALMLTASSAYAMQGGECEGKGGDREKKFQKVVDQLNLTDEQREELKTQHQEKKAAMKELREELNTNRKALHEELKKYDSDRNTIKSTTKKISSLQTQLMETRTESFLSMKEILTREQFEEMNKIMDEKRAEWKEKMKNGKKGGKGKGMGKFF